MMRRPQRYGWAAPAYDLVSFEWPVYRAGRVAGVEALGLKAGDSVLDLGCGTGLSLPLLRDAVGPAGHVVGVDASRAMLTHARRRVRSAGWSNVELVHSDAAGTAILDDGVGAGGTPFDAAIFVYALSLMSPWEDAWAQAVRLVRPGGRLAVVDMALPTGCARPFGPLARLACLLGGADIDAHPWTAVERDLTDVTAATLRGGHLQVRAGMVPVAPPTRPPR